MVAPKVPIYTIRYTDLHPSGMCTTISLPDGSPMLDYNGVDNPVYTIGRHLIAENIHAGYFAVSLRNQEFGPTLATDRQWYAGYRTPSGGIEVVIAKSLAEAELEYQRLAAICRWWSPNDPAHAQDILKPQARKIPDKYGAW